MKRKKIIIPLLLVATLLIGCTQTRILERISLVTLVGYDKDKEDRVAATAVIRQIDPNYESSIEIQSETEQTSKGTRTKLDMRTAKQLMVGQLRVVLFGEELAKAGVDEAVHTLMMNSEVSTSIYLAVVRSDTKSMIEYKYETITDIGQYLFNLLEHNIEQQQSISSKLHEVARDKYSPYREFAMPLLKRDGEYIKIDGVGFFKDGKMVGDLPADDIYYIMMLRDNFNQGTLELEISPAKIVSDGNDSEPLRIAIDSIQSDRKISIKNENPVDADIYIDMNCRLLEIDSSVSINDERVIGKVEEAMAKEMENHLNRVLKYSQHVNSDIFGFGEIYKSQSRNASLKENEWSKLYPEMTANVKVNVEIIRNGAFE